MSLAASIKINKTWQFFALIIGVVCIIMSIIDSEIYVGLLGAFITIRAIITLKQIFTAKSDVLSSQPKETK
jgi:hypothetical protein